MRRMRKIAKSLSGQGVGQVLSASAVALGGTLAGLYALNRLRGSSRLQALLDTLPPRVDVGIQDNTAEPADEMYDPADVASSPTTRWEDVGFDELYRLARQHHIVGRSSMRKPELVAALKDAWTNADIK